MQWIDRVGRRLKLRDLHILLAVVQCRSMAKAASELAISQPAVSKAIADMEHALGLRLLDRTRQGIEPTMYGRALIRRGLAVFDELRQGVKELEFLADPTAGELRIGSQESIAAGLLPAIIDRFSQQYPRVALHVAQAVFGTMLYRELRERTVDVVLSRILAPLPEDDLEVQILFDDPVVVVAARQSRWAHRRSLKLSDLADEAWILPPADSLPGALAADLFRASGLDIPRSPLTTLSVHLCGRLVATGRFVAVLPSSVLHFRANDLSLKVLPVKFPVQLHPVGIVTLKNRTLSPVTELFISCAREVTHALAKTEASGRSARELEQADRDRPRRNQGRTLARRPLGLRS
jgi:DNA-binding transcriptional LysR family regulator